MANLGRFVKGRFKPTGFDIGKGRNIAGIKWQGLDKVIKNLNKEISMIEGRTVGGMLQAGLLVKREAQKITPVDTSNLKASAYVVWGGGKANTKVRRGSSDGKFRDKTKSKSSKGSASKMASQDKAVVSERSSKTYRFPFAEIGFTAFYALFVHENLTASHVKRKKVKLFGGSGETNVQSGQAKFLEQALMQNAKRVFDIITRKAKIKR